MHTNWYHAELTSLTLELRMVLSDVHTLQNRAWVVGGNTGTNIVPQMANGAIFKDELTIIIFSYLVSL